MDIGTTSISELPIQTNQPVVEQNEMIENLQNNEMIRNIDNEVINQKIEAPKKVTFEEPDIINSGSNINHVSSKDMFVLKLEHKIIILATFFLFVFLDKKFQRYILNILVQVFGSFLQTDHGNMTKIGTFFYAMFFGFSLLLIVTFVDFTAFHLAF
tara:strand:+ start:368 stop:835 length:468 start_codon:yes stop_codon:yes gene_type:complete